MPDISHLLWCDLETTGTDEHLDSIIEVGLILTGSGAPFVDRDGFRDLVRPTPTAMGRLRGNDVVRKMHEANGLLAELEAAEASVTLDELLPPDKLQDEILKWMLEHGVRRHQVMLAGSGVGHFDRRFLREQMPELESWLAYPVLDVGVIRRFFQMCDRPDLVRPADSNKNHRAYDDAKLHLEEARHFARIADEIARGVVG